MLHAMHDNTRRLGFSALYAPLRPTEKEKEPATPFADYVRRRRADGLPFDAWIRTHVRVGAEVIKIAPRSMVVAGSIAEWPVGAAAEELVACWPHSHRHLLRCQ